MLTSKRKPKMPPITPEEAGDRLADLNKMKSDAMLDMNKELTRLSDLARPLKKQLSPIELKMTNLKLDYNRKTRTIDAEIKAIMKQSQHIVLVGK